MEKHRISRLVGAPPGYVGYDEGGQLTEAVRRNPYTIVLLDEIEKAHPDVFNILLQVLDDGRLTDSKGVVVDFKNTVLIMTSNIGSRTMLDGITDDGVLENTTKEAVLDELRQHFKPEFLNRIDDTILFTPLTLAVVKQIIDKIVHQLSDRLAQQDIKLELTQDAIDWIAKNAYEPEYGARPIKRFMTKYLETPLAKALVGGQVVSNTVVLVGVKDDMLIFDTR